MLTLAFKLGQWVRDLVWKSEFSLASSENGDTADDFAENTNVVDHIQHVQHVDGMVTSVHGDYVLVDDHICCKLTNVIGGQIPRKGDSVRVSYKTNKNSPESGAVVADSLRITTDNWDNEVPQDQPKSDALDNDGNFGRVGKVTNVQGSCIVVDGDFKFNLKKGLYKDFIPMVGDWILINVAPDQDEKEVPIFDVKPVRSRTTDGIITWQHLKFGAINNQIYFHPASCLNDYKPQVGDQVRVTSIESVHGNYEWRAITVIPKMARSPLQNHRHPNMAKKVTSVFRPLPSNVAATCSVNSNPKGVSVSPENVVDFNTVTYGVAVYQTVWIRNESEDMITLLSCKVADEFQMVFNVTQPCLHDNKDLELYNMQSLPVNIPSGSRMSVSVECHANELGLHQHRVCYKFNGFSIQQNLKVNVTHQLIEDCTRNTGNNRDKLYDRTSKYSNYASRMDEENLDRIPGIRPARKMQKIPVYMQYYPVPQYLKNIVLNKVELMDVLPWLTEDLSMKNHEQKFSTLLFLEEIQVAINLAEHDIEDAYFTRKADFLTLEVPGLVDGALSLMLGDRVLATNPRNADQPVYEGCIHDILGETIFLMFNRNFHENFNGGVFHVRFEHSRTSLRRKHQALRLSEMFEEAVLFPKSLTNTIPQVEFQPLNTSCSHCAKDDNDKRKPGYVKYCPCQCHGDFAVITCGGLEELSGGDGCNGKVMQWFNRSLNTRQRVAVQRILEGRSRPSPYVLYGPPGTGKTVTVVEAILQVLHLRSDSRVLVCAPSNSAADLLCERLHNSRAVSVTDMIRLNAMHRNENSLQDVVKMYSTYGTVTQTMIRYRVIAGTCTVVGHLFNLGVTLGHFTHVFVDEAGQAMEPECLVPLCLTVGNKDAVMVLSGDPNQLGPVIQSRLAATYGLQVSLLERLLQSSLYTRDDTYDDKYNPHVVTRLVNNYRSHPSILHVSSKLFYNCELEVCASKPERECLCEWEGLLTKGFPIVFHATKGEELREFDCPSWFNPAEALTVLFQVMSLYNYGLTPEDIGIITPYRKQVEKIRMMLNSTNVPLPKIGSVEEFQGQERKVIIVSTVRSSMDTSAPINAKIGFIGNPKRFNVTMSRAKALLLVIGDPFLLLHDENWAKFIEYCLEHDAVKGCNVAELKNKVNQAK